MRTHREWTAVESAAVFVALPLVESLRVQFDISIPFGREKQSTRQYRLQAMLTTGHYLSTWSVRGSRGFQYQFIDSTSVPSSKTRHLFGPARTRRLVAGILNLSPRYDTVQRGSGEHGSKRTNLEGEEVFVERSLGLRRRWRFAVAGRDRSALVFRCRLAASIVRSWRCRAGFLGRGSCQSLGRIVQSGDRGILEGSVLALLAIQIAMAYSMSL